MSCEINVECCLNQSSSHYCIQAIGLSCGHFICSECLNENRGSIDFTFQKFSCKHCGIVDEAAKIDSTTISNIGNLYGLFQDTVKQYKTILNTLDGIHKMLFLLAINFIYFKSLKVQWKFALTILSMRLRLE